MADTNLDPTQYINNFPAIITDTTYLAIIYHCSLTNWKGTVYHCVTKFYNILQHITAQAILQFHTEIVSCQFLNTMLNRLREAIQCKIGTARHN